MYTWVLCSAKLVTEIKRKKKNFTALWSTQKSDKTPNLVGVLCPLLYRFWDVVDVKNSLRRTIRIRVTRITTSNSGFAESGLLLSHWFFRFCALQVSSFPLNNFLYYAPTHNQPWKLDQWLASHWSVITGFLGKLLAYHYVKHSSFCSFCPSFSFDCYGFMDFILDERFAMVVI